MKAYEYVLILHPTPEEKKAGSTSSFLTSGVELVMAPNDQAAAMMAGRAIPEEHISHLDRIEVAVRPF